MVKYNRGSRDLGSGLPSIQIFPVSLAWGQGVWLVDFKPRTTSIKHTFRSCLLFCLGFFREPTISMGIKQVAIAVLWGATLVAPINLTRALVDFPLIASQGERLIYIDGQRGQDGPGRGGASQPYRSITYALRQVGDRNPATLQLAPGTYSVETGELFPLTLPRGITLQGEESDKGERIAVIGGGDFTSALLGPQSAAVVALSGSTIRGVSITNPQPEGIGVWIESAGVSVVNNTFINNGREGVAAGGESSLQVIGNRFRQNRGNGMAITGTTRGEIRDNDFVENTEHGLIIGGSAIVELRENRFSQNSSGVVATGQAAPFLRGNRIENNQSYGVVAAEMAKPDLGRANSLGRNRIRGNGTADIRNGTLSNGLILAIGNELEPNRLVGLVDAVLIRPSGDSRFRDIQGHWAQSYISALANRGIVAGFPEDNTFRPNERVSRAQFAAMLRNAFAVTGSEPSREFTDVPRNFWAWEAITAASRSRFLAGYPDGSFQPQQEITRMQALVALGNGLNLRSSDPSILNKLADRQQIPEWARPAIAGALQQGLVINYPDPRMLTPNRNATRGEVAAFIYQALVREGRAEEVGSQYLVR